MCVHIVVVLAPTFTSLLSRYVSPCSGRQKWQGLFCCWLSQKWRRAAALSCFISSQWLLWPDGSMEQLWISHLQEVRGHPVLQTPANLSGHHQPSGWLPQALWTPGFPGFAASSSVWLCWGILRSVVSAGHSNSPACMGVTSSRITKSSEMRLCYNDENFAIGFFVCMFVFFLKYYVEKPCWIHEQWALLLFLTASLRKAKLF